VISGIISYASQNGESLSSLEIERTDETHFDPKEGDNRKHSVVQRGFWRLTIFSQFVSFGTLLFCVSILTSILLCLPV
jgi:hypothetical protein